MMVDLSPADDRRNLLIARFCGLGAMFIGIAGMAGWIFNIPALNSIIPGYKPIAISATILFVILGGVQLLLTHPRLSPVVRLFLLAVTLFVTLFGLLEIVQTVTGAPVSIEDAILRHYPALFANPDANISPVAGLLVFLIGLAQACYVYQQVVGKTIRPLSHAVGIVGSLVMLISAIFLLSYLYRAPLLYSTAYIPIAALATLAALLSGIGLITTVGDAAVPLRWFSGPSMRARLLRAFLPLTVLLMLLLSVTQYLLTRLTSINPAIFAPVIVIIFEVIITAVILHVARAMGTLIERAENERRQAEEALRQLNANLEDRVRARTAELETAVKELEAFSYSVAHDLRSPLRSLDGFSKYLLEHSRERLNAQEQDYLHRMRMAAQRMARLIDDLLNLAHVGRTPMHIETVNLSELATDILAGLRRRDPQRQVITTIAPAMLVQGDRGLLQIALEHLLANAWKFTGKREDARIIFGMDLQDGVRIFAVRDNGAGFDMTYAEKLFTPFQRLHTEDEFPGTGIGLAVVQRIIARHGGRVWAEAEKDSGATVYFTVGKAAS